MIHKILALFSSAPAEEFEPLEEEEFVYEPAAPAAATVPAPLELKPIVINLDDEEEAPAAVVPPVLSPKTKAQEELEVAQNNLEVLTSSKASALEEVELLEQVHETNKAIRQLVVEMGEQRLLPSQLEERRLSAMDDNKSVADMFKDLGF